MKLSSSQSFGFLIAFGSLFQQLELAQLALASSSRTTQQVQSKLIDRCCQVGRERAIESSKFNCKLGAREALLGNSAQASRASSLALTAESLLASEPNFADQCEMVLESCCMGHHRTRNCDSGKQFAKSGAACMDVELSKEATIATESFNDCCMSCSLGILAARNPAQNETTTTTTTTSRQQQQQHQGFSNRCKLISPLASSLSGQLYEQTYIECCQENLPKLSSALLDTGAPIDCGQSNPCAQRCLPADSSPGRLRGAEQQDRCDCFAGYKLAPDGVNCVDVDECKLGTHTCDKDSAICDNIKGSYRCLARHSGSGSGNFHHHQHHQQHQHQSHQHQFHSGSSGSEEQAAGEQFVSLRLCPLGARWSYEESRCLPVLSAARGASLLAGQSAASRLQLV